eukprot:Clim_evm11s2 gene=Clim_evmTU11s2
MEVYEAFGMGNAPLDIAAAMHERRDTEVKMDIYPPGNVNVAEQAANGGPVVSAEGSQNIFQAYEFPTSRSSMPTHWAHQGEVTDKDGHMLKIIFSLKLQNTDQLQSEFEQRNNPESPVYQQWLNVAEVAEIVRPDQDHIDAVESWLESINYHNKSKTTAEDLMTVHMKVSDAEDAFGCTFHHFTHKDDPDKQIIRTMEYTVPKEVGEVLHDISGIFYFPKIHTVHSAPANRRRRRDTNFITPSAIESAYDIGGYVATNTNTSQAIASFQGQFFSPNDLAEFQDTFDVIANPIATIEGENNSSEPGLEASLDVQYITGVGQNITTWVVYQNSFSLTEWIDSQIDNDDSPWVHSISYGQPEFDAYQENPTNLNNQFMKFGTMGRSILVASGDSGVSCTSSSPYVNVPDFPASSPYVTAVGGTNGLSEGWSGSGGGFSTIFGRPSYQDTAVPLYFNRGGGGLPSSSQYTSGGRAYPDVSALSTDFIIIKNGVEVTVDGTSAASPTFAGVISMLNDVSFNNGGNSLGFLNPLLYQMWKDDAVTFNDIKSGNNGYQNCSGFNAIEGWDPVTGLGSPNFGEMSEYVKDLALGKATPSDPQDLSDSTSAVSVSTLALFLSVLVAFLM